ncbi:MAG TPA: cytochrome b N-terminal domain-containing protein [Terriglobales bacterium]|nr:cytochrome b N-terminal domain-containing protein [Terriglobales bacterium]
MNATGPQENPARANWVDWLERRLNLSEIFSFLTHFGLVYTPVDTTKPVREVLRDVGERRVPRLAQGSRVLGLFAVILFGLQVVTGVLLAYYYRPTPAAAFESTRTIVRDLPAGWFIHQMHVWGSWLLVIVIVLRLLRLFWDGLYRAPREILWWCAVATTWLVIQLDFTGRLLVWDSQTYWSTVRGLELVFAIPIVGPVLAFLLGGRVMSEDVLTRFYVLHVMVLPLFYAGFLYLTFATLRRIGVSGETREPERTIRYRDHVYSMTMLTILLFAVLVTLATLAPFHFHGPADPYATPGEVRPPWYMLASYALLQHFPLPALSGLVLFAAAIAVLLLPLWLRDETPAARARTRIVGAAVLVVWIALSVLGALLGRR